MKKLFLATAVLLGGWLGAQTTYVADWQDVNKFSSSEYIGGVQVIVDPSTGNLFTVGNFESQIVIGTYTLTATGDQDIYVAKYTAAGAVTKAVKLGTSNFDEGFTLCYRDNHVFVGAIADGDGTIYKLDDDGTPLDVVTTRSLGWDVRPRSLFTYGSTGKILVGGSFITEAWFPTSASTSIYRDASNYYSGSCSGDCFDSFTGIIDASTVYFTHALNPEYSTESNEIMSIWGRNGRIYCTGYFRDDLQWAPSGTTYTALGVQDAFVASVYITTLINTMSYNDDVVQAGSNESSPGGSSALDPFWKECGYGIAANGTAIYVTGNLNSASSGVFGAISYTGAGAFTARIDYNGSNVGTENWVRTCVDASLGSPVMRSIGYGIAIDALGNIFSTGRGMCSVEFEGGGNPSLVTDPAPDGRPGYISRYNASGDLLSLDIVNQDWTLTSRTEGRSIVANGCEVYTTGFTQLDDFQAGNLASEIVGSGKTAMYIFEISRDATISNHITYCESCASFPNVLGLSASGGTSYAWSGPGIPPNHLVNYTTATPTYSLTSCASSGTTDYTCTITNTVTGCTTTASVTVTAGSSAAGVANAGADKLVCPNTNYTLGTNVNGDGLTFYWEPQYYLGSTWNQEQPTFSGSSFPLLPLTYTLTVTDVCGNTSTDQVTVSVNPICPRRMMNPDLTGEVFPNPSEGIFTVNLPLTETDQEIEFVVTDLAGRTVQQNTVTSGGGQHAVDLSAEPKGVYVLTVTRNGVSEVYKLVME
jgi:hypothetical protein